MRIFVTIGTGRFDALIKKMDSLKLDVIAQTGNIDFVPQNLKHFRFTNNIDEYYKKADLIISHGGAGTIYELLNKNKKVIAVANKDRTDEHQEEILRALSKEGYLIWCKNLRDLKKCIQRAKKFKFKKYKKPKCEIARRVKEFLR
nr:hypothetical protein [Nanoarchaeota archaeon]